MFHSTQTQRRHANCFHTFISINDSFDPKYNVETTCFNTPLQLCILIVSLEVNKLLYNIITHGKT